LSQSPVPLMDDGALDGVEVFAWIFGEVLWPVNFNGQLQLGAKQVGFQFAPSVKGDGQFDIQLK
jgi:hypothetical protein